MLVRYTWDEVRVSEPNARGRWDMRLDLVTATQWGFPVAWLGWSRHSVSPDTATAVRRILGRLLGADLEQDPEGVLDLSAPSLGYLQARLLHLLAALWHTDYLEPRLGLERRRSDLALLDQLDDLDLE